MPLPVRLVLTAAALGLALTGCGSAGGGSAPAPSSSGSGGATAPGTSGSGAAGTGSPTPALPTGPAGNGSSSPTQASGTGACIGSHLAVTAGQTGAAAGHVGARVVFKNTSNAACTLYGFPGVAGLDANGKQLVQAKRVTSSFLGTAKEAFVTLAPGGFASALIGGVDIPSGNATSCPNYPALLVTPPGTRASSKVALQMPGCPTLVVYPIVAGIPTM
ncbi:DUF4232 domain-containing protein [Streptacidiphilus sp. PAMC 29251]